MNVFRAIVVFTLVVASLGVSPPNDNSTVDVSYIPCRDQIGVPGTVYLEEDAVREKQAFASVPPVVQFRVSLATGRHRLNAWGPKFCDGGSTVIATLAPHPRAIAMIGFPSIALSDPLPGKLRAIVGRFSGPFSRISVVTDNTVPPSFRGPDTSREGFYEYPATLDDGMYYVDAARFRERAWLRVYGTFRYWDIPLPLPDTHGIIEYDITSAVLERRPMYDNDYEPDHIGVPPDAVTIPEATGTPKAPSVGTK